VVFSPDLPEGLVIQARRPSPLAGEGGPRSGSDEGSKALSG
jgi:hypothetical protein